MEDVVFISTLVNVHVFFFKYFLCKGKYLLKRVLLLLLLLLLLCLKMLIFVLFYINLCVFTSTRDSWKFVAVCELLYFCCCKVWSSLKHFICLLFCPSLWCMRGISRSQIHLSLQQRKQEERRAETTENRHQTMDFNCCFAKRNMFTGFALITYYY